MRRGAREKVREPLQNFEWELRFRCLPPEKNREVTMEAITPKKETRSIPQALVDLDHQLTPHDAPATRKRTRSPKKAEQLPSSPARKKRLHSSILASPDTTPINKGSQISAISPFVDRTVRKLEFGMELPSPPVTPVKQIRSEAEGTQNAIGENNKENVDPKELSAYVRAKAIFQRSSPVKFHGNLPQREKEAEALKGFLLSHITARQSSSLYVSGPPGTGKTAQLSLTLAEFIDVESTEKLQDVEIDGTDYKVGYAYINCMTVSKSSNIFSEIYLALTGEKIHLKGSKEILEQFLSSDRAHMSVVVLDELDQLLGKQTDEVFTLFSWALTCNIILVGISNALDMVDRLLPRLKMNGLSPNTLVFMPYTADQIASIIRAKLDTLDEPNMIHPSAIQLCSKKSASNTGDLRKAFDICRSAIESVEKEARGNNSLHSKAPVLTVKIQHIARVTNAVFNANPTNKLRALNLSQKLLVCLLVKAEMDDPFRTLTVNGFYEHYTKRGRVDSLVGMLKKTEFLEVLSGLESNSIVRVHRSTRAFSESKVSSSIVKSDLAGVIKGVYVLERLMGEHVN